MSVASYQSNLSLDLFHASRLAWGFEWDYNAWSRHLMFKGKKDWYLQPILNHISMNRKLVLIIDGINLITSKWHELNCSNSRFGSLQDNAMHVLNHGLAYWISSMHFRVFFKTQKIKQHLESLIFKRWPTML
jgi:hypothetical protein